MNLDPRLLAGFVLLGLLAAARADYAAEVLADTPIAYWRLDDADGSNIADSSGNDHNGAVDGFDGSINFGESSLLRTEPGNGAITLAGLDRILIPGFDKIGDEGYTAEYWIKLDQLPTGFLNLVGDGTGGGTFFMMNYTHASGFVRPHYSFANSPVSLDTVEVLVPGTTYHVVTTWDATDPDNNNGKIYFNGVLVREGNVSGNPDPANEANSVYIGRDDRENRAANFTIDEVALYDFPLTQERVVAHWVAGSGGIVPPTNYEEEVLFDSPLAYWRLGEAAGPTAADSSGNGRDATADAGVAFAQDTLVPPDTDTAVGVSGDPRVVSARFEKVDGGTSLEFWVLFNAAPAGGAFANLVGDGESTDDFHLIVQAGGEGIVRAHVQTDAGSVSVDSPDPLVDERMHHVAATWDATSGDLRLYVDEVEVATANQAGGAINTDNPIFIGRDGREPGLFDGVIDEVAVYDFALPADRIAARFSRVDVPPTPPPPLVNGAYANLVISDGPVAYWRLGEADGTAIFDQSGNNHHGAQDGTEDSIAYLGESLVPAEAANGSISLAGSDRIIVPGFEKIGDAGYTAEYWVKVTAFPTSCCDNFVGDGTGGGDFWMMNYLIGPGQGTTGAVRPHFGVPGTVSITTNDTPLVLDQVYHVVTTYDSTLGMGHVYFDGVAVLSLPVTATIPAPGGAGDNDVYIGRDNRENRPSNFMIDEIALYDFPLTDEQILNHYNTGINPGPIAPFQITSFDFSDVNKMVSLTFNSSPVDTYRLAASSDLNTWFELEDGIESGGNTTSLDFDLGFFFPDGIPGRLFFRIEVE